MMIANNPAHPSGKKTERMTRVTIRIKNGKRYPKTTARFPLPASIRTFTVCPGLTSGACSLSTVISFSVDSTDVHAPFAWQAEQALTLSILI